MVWWVRAPPARIVPIWAGMKPAPSTLPARFTKGTGNGVVCDSLVERAVRWTRIAYDDVGTRYRSWWACVVGTALLDVRSVRLGARGRGNDAG